MVQTGFSAAGSSTSFVSKVSKKRNYDELNSDTEPVATGPATEGSISANKDKNDLWTKKYTPFNLVSITYFICFNN